MVKKHWLLLLLICTFAQTALFSQDVKVTAEIEKDAEAGKNLKGTITITHDRNDSIETDSFLLDDRHLKVDFLKEVELSPTSDVVISLYNFTIEPKEPGLHVLPAITVTVGKKKQRSVATSYVVREKGSSRLQYGRIYRSSTGQSPSRTTRLSIILELENIVEGDTTLYPGQQLVVGYRFIYNFSVDLSKEELPLLEAEGFEKVGAKDTREFKEGELNYLEARQLIEAVTPGEYKFPQGVIEGRAYRIDRLGNKSIAPDDSRAESAPLTIHVVPFPEKEKPPSFNGAIGTSLEFEMTLLSADKVTVGDKMTLLIKISGEGMLSTMPMPEVCCQPGFSGFFRLSDLPPVEELIGTAKTFKVELRPLSSSIKEIPTLEFSYFNPETKSYTVLKSDPIPIQVEPIKGEPTEEQRRILFEEKGKELDERPVEEKVLPDSIEIEGNYPLAPSNLENLTFGTWWVLLIIPIGVGFIFLQVHFRNYLIRQRSKVKVKRSEDYFNEAMHQKIGTAPFFNLLQKAFLLRLVERGDIPTDKISPDYLPLEGAPGKVRALMREIEEKRFAPIELDFGEDFIPRIKKLFYEIKPEKER